MVRCLRRAGRRARAKAEVKSRADFSRAQLGWIGLDQSAMDDYRLYSISVVVAIQLSVWTLDSHRLYHWTTDSS